jgi:hypothetical protein
MEKETLMKVFAKINAMIEYCNYTSVSEDWIENYGTGYKDSLKELREYLQEARDADVHDSEPPTEFWEPRRLSADELEDELPF